ncbi:MAG: MFS transporter [Firmicutes bacterium]|nr:MFS transporter [Bacillota bacterium]
MKGLKGRYLLVLIALCGIMAASGGLTVNVAGLFFSPMSEEFSVGRGSIALGMTICNLAGSFAGLAVGRVVRSERFRPAVLAGSAVTAGASALLSLTRGLVSLYLLQALRGVSTGLVGMVLATMMLNNWFRAGAGLFTSIVMGFSGLASALFSPVLSGIIQSQGWRAAYFASAALIVLFSLPVVLFPIGLKPADVGMEPFGEEPGREGAARTAEAPSPIRKDLLALCLLYAVLTGFLPTVVQHLPGIAESYMLAASVGAAMLSVGMIANTGGKLIIGVLVDRLGTRLSVLIMSCAVALGVISVMTVRNAAGMLAGAALIGFAYSLCTVGIVMTVRDSFGAANYGLVYPKASLCMTVTYALGSSLIGFVYDATRSYVPILWLILAVLAGTASVTLAIYARKGA